ncbi:MAG: nuclear transport factor 2 family protein [Burkholderiales bacterium]|nr:nuclear transport factor 2 family protein [Burkholderiales bacterium]
MLTRLLAMLAITLSLAGCSTMGASTGDAAAAAEQLRLLMIDPNKAGLEAIVADELSYGHSGGKVDTKASFIADLLSGASDFVTITISDQTVRPVGNATLIRHTLSATTNDGGKPGTVTIKILQVWQQQGGQWKLIARQAVRPPA